MKYRSILAAPVLLALSAVGLGAVTPIASAQEPPPIQYEAVGNDDCTFTVTFDNRTNSRFYQIDYRIDGEDPRTTLDGIPIYRWGPWPDAEVPFNTLPYVWDREPLRSVKTQNIRNVVDLPNPDQDSHQVDVRIAVGPQTAHRLPEWRTIEVTGCLTKTSVSLTGPASAELGADVTFEVETLPTGATGTVQFYDGDDPIGESVTVVEGTASLTHAFETSGPHTITARFDAAGRFADSVSEPLTVVVPEAPPGPGSGSLGSLDVGSLFSSTGSGPGSVGPDSGDPDESGPLGSLVHFEFTSTGGATPH